MTKGPESRSPERTELDAAKDFGECLTRLNDLFRYLCWPQGSRPEWIADSLVSEARKLVKICERIRYLEKMVAENEERKQQDSEDIAAVTPIKAKAP